MAEVVVDSLSDCVEQVVTRESEIVSFVEIIHSRDEDRERGSLVIEAVENADCGELSFSDGMTMRRNTNLSCEREEGFG